jgi:nucleoside-diphosphate-sugar epimerase
MMQTAAAHEAAPVKKVLVTGASGFIGRHCLLPLLARGHDVHAVTTGPALDEMAGVTWHRADLLDPAQVRALIAAVQPSHLLHLAWDVEHGKFWTSPGNLQWVQASLELAQAFVAAGGVRMVAAGTNAEYDWRYGWCTENITPLAPATLYGASKHALNITLSAYAAQVGLSAAWGRIFFLYGPGEHPSRLVSSVTRALLKREPAPMSHGQQRRDFLYVGDVGDAFAALLDSAITGPVNIASGVPVTVRDMAYTIADALDAGDLIRLGALPTPPDDPPLLAGDPGRLRNEVGWQPCHTLADGIGASIAWWRERMES